MGEGGRGRETKKARGGRTTQAAQEGKTAFSGSFDASLTKYHASKIDTIYYTMFPFGMWSA